VWLIFGGGRAEAAWGRTFSVWETKRIGDGRGVWAPFVETGIRHGAVRAEVTQKNVGNAFRVSGKIV
jgi:hypothetical protein